MDIDDERIRYAVRHTEVLRLPRQSLATFGTTNIGYYLVTRPVYSELAKGVTETVVREGRVIADRPRIVTPYYLSRLEGFTSEARRYFDMLIKTHGPDIPGLFYTYRNEPKGLTIVAESLASVVDRINGEVDKRGDPLVTIIKGEDELWDVSLMKFINDMTRSSLRGNLLEFKSRGLLDVDASGVPLDARVRIEELFGKLVKGEVEPREL
ncbi:MAG: hypothetical protein V3W01_02610, partial [Dehalococcoidales bacterium]